MLETSPIQLVKNLPLSMYRAEDVEVGSGTSFTTKSAKNSLLDMSENAKVGNNDDGGDDKIVKRSPLKKSSGLTGYFTFLSPRKR